MKRKYSVRTIIAVIDIVLFATFIIGIFIIGGVAIGGKIESGKYYIWDIIIKYKNGVKAYVEVPKAAYIYSTVHFYLIVSTTIFFSITKATKRASTTTQK